MKTFITAEFFIKAALISVSFGKVMIKSKDLHSLTTLKIGDIESMISAQGVMA